MVTLTACEGLNHKERVNQPELQTADTVRRIQARARRLLSRKDYAGALDFITAAFDNGADERDLSREYLQAVAGSLVQAETLIQAGEYRRGALLLKGVQASGSRSPGLQEQIAVPPAEIQVKIAYCAEQLMEAGLRAYRSGELATAVNIWQQVLEFDPHHQAAHKSIQISQQQISNIKALKTSD